MAYRYLITKGILDCTLVSQNVDAFGIEDVSFTFPSGIRCHPETTRHTIKRTATLQHLFVFTIKPPKTTVEAKIQIVMILQIIIIHQLAFCLAVACIAFFQKLACSFTVCYNHACFYPFQFLFCANTLQRPSVCFFAIIFFMLSYSLSCWRECALENTILLYNNVHNNVTVIRIDCVVSTAYY